jgi:3-hydroxyisobutyrate dehydrogenase
MTTIAIHGLGHMGSRMAARLVAAGHKVTVWNRTRAKAEAITGADVAATPADAAAGADVVITMLTGPEAVESVVHEAAGAIRPGSVLVEMSTIGPTALAALASRLPEGVGLVDAPVGGSIDRAERGELVVLTGGTDADVATVAPVLEQLGNVVRCGGPGTAAAAKLVAISAAIAGMTLLGELRAIGAALGLDDQLTARLLATGPLAALDERAKSTGSHYAVELAAKDLALTVEHASTPLARTALDIIRGALPQLADRDLGALAGPTT